MNFFDSANAFSPPTSTPFPRTQETIRSAFIAPEIRATSRPPLKSTIVGMLWMQYLAAMLGFSSVSTLASRKPGSRIEAALTGHLVLTSMHGNNASAVIQRLYHFGIDPVLLSQAVSLIVVQQPAKKLCQNCVTLAEVAPTIVESLKERKIIPDSDKRIALPIPKGCKACNNTGFIGRTAVQEVISFDDGIRSALIAGAKPEELLEIATKRRRYVSFAQGEGILIAKKLLTPGDALLLVTE